MRRFAIFLTTVLFLSSASATTPTAESIVELVSLTTSDSMVDSMFANIRAIFKRQTSEGLSTGAMSDEKGRLAEAIDAKVTEILREELSLKAMRPALVQLYQDNFSQEEVDGLVAFHKSPAGVAMMEKMPRLMQKMFMQMQERMGPVMARVKAATDQMRAEAKASQ